MSASTARLETRGASSPTKRGAARARVSARAWLVHALVALAALVGVGANESQVSEHAAKAMMLVKFLGYVKWPADAFETEESPFRLAVVGADPFGKSLDEAFAGKKYGSRPIEVVRFRSVAEVEKCHLLFVPEDEAPRLEKLVERTKGGGVLLVGESADFAARGGVINFYLERKRLRFEINPDAGKRARIEISSQLLSLAKIVKDARQGEAPR